MGHPEKWGIRMGHLENGKNRAWENGAFSKMRHEKMGKWGNVFIYGYIFEKWGVRKWGMRIGHLKKWGILKNEA